ncbi:MliC family protein [Shewanella gaetbuli]|uniref:MliC family protein n=1 Tax=Shewanella gaetbuli TaxID=220752 RepID=A0A9X1ZM35_9GAMM|nr:MliC family protein [Shewanella gaetbuli]MCL1144101.1 MliC family protein [Shewanella gaetbuli]
MQVNSTKIACILVTLLSTNLHAQSPSFDCQKAQGEIETLICQTDELAQLDNQLAPLYQKLISQVDANELKLIKAEQRGWIKGRNDCWKADDKLQCTKDNYQTRITELQIAAGAVEVPKEVNYQCQADKPFNLIVYFYNNTALPAAVFHYAGQNIPPTTPQLGLLTKTASGAKYVAQNTSLWTHQDEARLEEYGQKPVICVYQQISPN